MRTRLLDRRHGIILIPYRRCHPWPEDQNDPELIPKSARGPNRLRRRFENEVERFAHHTLAVQELCMMGVGDRDERRRDLSARECLRAFFPGPRSLVLARHDDGSFEAANPSERGRSWRADEDRSRVALREAFDQRLGAERTL